MYTVNFMQHPPPPPTLFKAKIWNPVNHVLNPPLPPCLTAFFFHLYVELTNLKKQFFYTHELNTPLPPPINDAQNWWSGGG